jgi:phospholipid/cholesterol/gamma-HCH transport system substrate-binding protein
MNIKNSVPIPDDSSVKVASEGLLGGSYLAVLPGGSETNMKPGAIFDVTQGSVDLLTLFSKAMSGGDEKPETPAAPPATGTAPSTP